MDKVKYISIIIIAIASVVVTILVANVLLDTTGKVNQGNFRVSDVIVESSATLKEVQDEEKKLEKLSDIAFDVSQTNTISILIESNAEATEINIENIVITEPLLKGEMKISQEGHDKFDVTPELTSLPIDLEEDDGKYVITLLIDNNNVITNQSVGEDVEKIQYDASIFNALKVDVSQLKFNVSFDIVIKDTTGKIVKTNINLNIPTDETFSNGMSILRQDVTNSIFSIVE